MKLWLMMCCHINLSKNKAKFLTHFFEYALEKNKLNLNISNQGMRVLKYCIAYAILSTLYFVHIKQKHNLLGEIE